MERRYIIFITISLIIFIIITGLIIGHGLLKRQATFSPEEALTCKMIMGNNNKEGEKIDIVFLTDNVEEDKVKEYSDFFLDSPPFNENVGKFNFYYAGESGDCEIIKENILFCYSRDLIKKSAICPNDYVAVLSERPISIRSSAYLNVMSINTRIPKSVLLHEFGHVFANLADEYVPSILPRGAENCQQTCTDFGDVVLEGCFEGCSKNSYYRSSENSVMRSLRTNDYKKLNKMLIKERLDKYG